jgi:prevent-host-death family protein
MKSVDIHEAETHLSRLLQEVSVGEEIVIARAGKPIARLVAYAEPSGPRTPGCWRGQVRMADDFDETPQDVINSFYGEET